MWFAYILKCEDNSFYIGITQDLKRRFFEHLQGKGARFTKWRKPKEIVYFEPFGSKPEASKREKQLKCWSYAKKEALVVGDVKKLRRLSISHD